MIFYSNIILPCILIVTIFNELSQGAPPSKIVGGNVASIYNWPAIVSLQYNNFHMCGGTLITRCHVLTAAHCVYNMNHNSMVIATGSSDQMTFKHRYRVRRYEVHGGYRGQSTAYHNDIAIIWLDTCIVEDATQRVSLLYPNNLGPQITGTVVGWGKESYNARGTSRTLHQVDTWTIDNGLCIRNNPFLTIRPQQLCTTYGVGRGFCSGDSGSPLFVNNQVAGIVSLATGCGAGYYDVYTRVYSYLPWIQSKIQWR